MHRCLIVVAMLSCRRLVRRPQVEQPRFQQPSEAAVMGGVKANGKGLGWPLIAEAPTEGWPLLVDTCFQFSELARLLAGLFLLRGIAHLCWSLIVQQ